MTVKPARSSARPTRRHVRSNWSSTVSLYEPSVFLSMRARSGAIAACTTAARAAGSGVPNFIMRRVSISDFERRIGRHHRPRERGRRRVVDLAGRHLLHAAMRDVDLDGAGLGAALDARAELVLLVRRVEDVDVLADRAPEEVLRDRRRGSPRSRFPSCRPAAARPRARSPSPARTRATCSTPAPAWPSRPASARCRRGRSWRPAWSAGTPTACPCWRPPRQDRWRSTPGSDRRSAAW